MLLNIYIVNLLLFNLLERKSININEFYSFRQIVIIMKKTCFYLKKKTLKTKQKKFKKN
jgi:hypothetical protein